MFKNYIGFNEDLDCTVSVFTKTGISVGDGKLVLSPKCSPQVEFHYEVNIGKFAKNTFFKCTSDKGHFTLVNCEVIGNYIYPKLVIKGEKNSVKFKKVSVLIQGVSEWMDSTGEFSITDDEIIRTREKKTFRSNVIVNKKRISFYNEHWCHAKHYKENSHLITNYTLISFECLDGSLTITEFINISQSLRTIFTLLLGFNVGILYVIDQTNKNKNISIYHSNNTTDESNIKRKNDCFVSSKYLFVNEKWDSIFNNFFGEKLNTHEDIWHRVAGMLAYDGFWEYKILAYVSLLDRYVSLYSKEYEDKISISQFKIACRDMKKTLKLKADNKDVIFDNKKVYESMIEQVQSIENSNFSSFGQKFEFKCMKTDKNIIDIIDLSRTDFSHLKKLRNSIAHGDSPELKENSDITYEMTISNKVALLLRYWTFNDLGFSADDYIEFLTNWMYPITREARINKSALDFASGNCLYLNTNKTNFELAKKQKFGDLVMLYNEKNDTFRVNIESVNAVISWRKSHSKYNSVEKELTAVVDTNQVKSITYLNNAYLVCGNKYFKILGGMCVLNSPDYFMKFEHIRNRLCVFDSETKQWLPSEQDKRITKVLSS